MAFNLGSTTAVTYAGMTTKVWTFIKDLLNDGRSIRYLLDSMSGTGGTVGTHTVDSPRTIIFRRPESIRKPSRYNQTSGKYESVPRNVFTVTGQYAMNISAGQVEIAPFRMELSIPAGAVSYSGDQIDGYVGMYIAALQSEKANIITAIKTGAM